jgi:hypothetical protein
MRRRWRRWSTGGPRSSSSTERRRNGQTASGSGSSPEPVFHSAQSRPHRLDFSSSAQRRDRITARFCCTAYVAFWNKADLPVASFDVRGGGKADMPSGRRDVCLGPEADWPHRNPAVQRCPGSRMPKRDSEQLRFAPRTWSALGGIVESRHRPSPIMLFRANGRENMIADRAYSPNSFSLMDRRASLFYFAAAVPAVGFVHGPADVNPSTRRCSKATQRAAS